MLLRMSCNFMEPFYHSPPVNHGGAQIQLHEWPDECLWAQLQYERWQQSRNSSYSGTAYLDNLENEWSRRGICSRCHRDVDESLDTQMSDLEGREHNATDKLGRIRRMMAVTSDASLRPEIMKILDEQ
jgi:hypothetical protein